MKKKLFAVLFAIAVMLSAFTVVASAETDFYVLVSDSFIDNGGITQDELVDLNVKGIEIENTYGYAVVFAIIDSDLVEYYESAEDLYGLMTDNPNGLLVIDDLYNNEYNYYAVGDCAVIFEDSIDGIIDAYDVASTYSGGIFDYYTEVEKAIDAFNSATVNNGNEDIYTDGGYIADGDTDSYEPEAENAEEVMPVIIDDAGLLNNDEYKDVDKKFRELSDEYGFDFIGVTADDIGGMSANDYADFLYSVFKEGGIKDVAFYIYLHGEEGEREIVIVRYGKAEDELSDADCEKIIGNVKSTFADGDIAEGFMKMAEETDKVFNPSVSWIWIPLCLIIGFVIAFIVMKGIASANKSVRKKVNAVDYVKLDTLMITNAADIFLYEQTSSTPKASETSSSNTKSGGRSTSSGKF